MSLESINAQFLKLLKKNVKNDSTYNTWFKDATIININTTNAIIAVPNSFTKKLLMKTYYELVNNTINILCNSTLSVDFVEKQSDMYNSIINKNINNFHRILKFTSF